MSWNKNAFSYLIWGLYSFVAGVILIATGSVLCVEAGVAAYWGIALAVLYGIIVCATVFKLHSLAPSLDSFAGKNCGILTAAEALLVTVLFAAGLFLRIQGAGDAGLSSEYFEMAKVAAGQKIPQIVHGASYLYVQLLHEVFTLLGNQFVNGIWVQIALQMAALVLLYFVMRKLTGAKAALMTFGFFMCAPHMIQNALVLSPDMLYFLILMIAVCLIITGFGKKPEPAVFLLRGILAAFCCYLDITGGLLLIIAFGVIFCRREEPAEPHRKAVAAILCLTGAIAGFVVFIFLDALLSGKAFQGVIVAWLALYRPESFRLPVTFGTTGMDPEVWVLAGALAFGIFSFWCYRQEERISPGVVALYAVMAGGCFGIFAEESQGFFYTYVLLVLLAGVGVAQCLRADRLPEIEKEAQGQDSPEDDLVIEELTDSSPEGEETGEIREEHTASEESEAEDMETGEIQEEQTASVENEGEDMEEDILQREKALKEELKREKMETEHKVRFLENPLPVPRKHVNRVMDYPLRSVPDDDFDYPVSDDDDFDI